MHFGAKLFNNNFRSKSAKIIKLYKAFGAKLMVVYCRNQDHGPFMKLYFALLST